MINDASNAADDAISKVTFDCSSKEHMAARTIQVTILANFFLSR